MKEKMINRTHCEGYIYDHKLVKKVTGENAKTPGVEYITGDLKIATDDNCTNILTVYFSFVTAITSKKAPNATYSILDDIINGKIGTVMKNGKDNAGKAKIDSAVAVNDFYDKKDGTLVSYKRNEGGFVHLIDAIDPNEKNRNTFNTDMVITACTRVEGDPEKNTTDKVVVKGYIFDFKGAVLPVEYTARSPKAMDFFEGLDASTNNPACRRVWGHQISETITRTYTTENAFDDDEVREVQTSRKDWVITGCAPEPYVWDDPSFITAVELQNAIANRETYLATIKQRQDEYNASKNSTSANTSGYKF